MDKEEWDEDFVVAPIAAEESSASSTTLQEEVSLLPVVVVQETKNHPLIVHNDVGEENEQTYPLPSIPVGGINQEEENVKIFVEIEQPTQEHLEEPSSTSVITLNTTFIPNTLPEIEEKYNDIMSETVIKNNEKITVQGKETNEAPRMFESNSIHDGDHSELIREIHNDPNLGVEEAAIEIVLNDELDLDDNAISISLQLAPGITHIEELKVDEEDVLTIPVDASIATKTHIDEGITADSILPKNTSCDDDAANSLIESEQWDGDEEWNGDDSFVTAAVSTMPAVNSDAVDFDDEMQSFSPSETTTKNGIDLPCPPEHNHEQKQEEKEEEDAIVVNNVEEDEDEWADFEGPVTAPPPIITTAAAVTADEVPFVEVPEADLDGDRRVSEAFTPAADGSTTINSLPTEQEAVPITNTSQDSSSAAMRSTATAQEVAALRDVLGDRASLYASLREKCDMVFGDNPPPVSFPVDSKLPRVTVLMATTQAPNWTTYTVDEGHCTSEWSREQIQHAVMATIPADTIKINPRYDGLWLWVSNAKSHFVPVSAVPISHTASFSAHHAKRSPPVHTANPSSSKSIGKVDKGTSSIPMVTQSTTIIRPASPPQSPPYSPPSSPRQKIQLQPSLHTRPIGSNNDNSLCVGEWDIGEGKKVMPTPLPPRSAPPPSLPLSGNSSSSSSSLSSSASAGMRKLFSSFGSLPAAGDTKKPPSVTGTSTSSGRSIEGKSYENDVATNHTNFIAQSLSSSSSSLFPLPLNREVTGPPPNVVTVSATTDAFEDFDALFGGSDTTTTNVNATEQHVAAMPKAGSVDPNFFMFEPEISPAVTLFLQTLPDFSYVLKS